MKKRMFQRRLRIEWSENNNNIEMQQQCSQGALALDILKLKQSSGSHWGSHRSLQTISSPSVSRLTSTSSFKGIPLQLLTGKQHSKDDSQATPLVVRRLSRRQYQDFRDRQWRKSISKNFSRGSSKEILLKDKTVKGGKSVDSRNKMAVGVISSLRKNFQFKHAHIQKFFCSVKRFDDAQKLPYFTPF